MSKQTQEYFLQNLKRVDHLIRIHAEVSGDVDDEAADDVLRSAVVFLHASLEDLLRSALAEKWPLAPAAEFERVRLVGLKREKFTLEDLAKYRDRSVQDLFDESVSQSLATSNFNNVGDLETALARMGVSKDILGSEEIDRLQGMMSRRHLIVHRTDRNEATGKARAITVEATKNWRDTLKEFGTRLLERL